MIKEYIFVAINHNDEIQWVKGSSSKTRYFRTDKYLKGVVEYHNKYHPEDMWEVRKCVILEDELPESKKINCKSTKCENCTNHNYCDFEPQESEDKNDEDN